MSCGTISSVHLTGNTPIHVPELNSLLGKPSQSDVDLQPKDKVIMRESSARELSPMSFSAAQHALVETIEGLENLVRLPKPA
jgi:hypothetical protein